MYKALLVDDENLVLKSLEAGIDWRKSGYRVAGKANDGATALALVREIRPHVVFTDIRMPGMSGLELIKRIKELDADMQIIVISGYAEFAYVQKSLQFGVLGYCLKPFDDHEIETLLTKANLAIDESRRRREGRLLELVEDRGSAHAAEAFDCLLRGEGLTDDKLGVYVSIGRGRLSFGDDRPAVAVSLGSARTVYFVQSAEGANGSDLLADPIAVGEEIVGIGAAASERGLARLADAIEQATDCAWDFFVHGNRDGVFVRKASGAHEETSAAAQANGWVSKLEAAAVSRDAAGIRAALDALRPPERRAGLRIRHALRIYRLVCFYATSGRSDALEDEYPSAKEQLYPLYPSFESMLDALVRVVESGAPASAPAAPFPSALPEKTAHANLNEIVKHIHENFRGDLSIQSIGKRYFMNPNYVSQLFKKELKTTFTEYVTNVRLQEAKRLLRTTELSIGEVAENVGIRDYFYFIRVFKKHAEQTPRQFRLKEEKA
ncbi:response regulator [Cohnella sp. GCM10027633]|uniref:response regulator transcription factor n=1 Tax=unclassified Cohnella TaxID=2636738 RepID=UPI0036284332